MHNIYHFEFEKAFKEIPYFTQFNVNIMDKIKERINLCELCCKYWDFEIYEFGVETETDEIYAEINLKIIDDKVHLHCYSTENDEESFDMPVEVFRFCCVHRINIIDEILPLEIMYKRGMNEIHLNIHSFSRVFPDCWGLQLALYSIYKRFIKEGDVYYDTICDYDSDVSDGQKSI